MRLIKDGNRINYKIRLVLVFFFSCRIEHELGPAHDRRYIASVQIELSDKIFFMKGEERSKVKDAENSAASSMFYSLRELGY